MSEQESGAQSQREREQRLDAVATATDLFGVAISPWPLAIPVGVFGTWAAGSWLGVETIGWYLVAFSLSYVAGAALQVLGAWLFHRLLGG